MLVVDQQHRPYHTHHPSVVVAMLVSAVALPWDHTLALRALDQKVAGEQYKVVQSAVLLPEALASAVQA
jgi:hypothetical protein